MQSNRFDSLTVDGILKVALIAEWGLTLVNHTAVDSRHDMRKTIRGTPDRKFCTKDA